MGVFRNIRSFFRRHKAVFLLFLLALTLVNIGILCIANMMKGDLQKRESYEENQRQYTVTGFGLPVEQGLEQLAAEKKAELQYVFVGLHQDSDVITADYYADRPKRITVMYGVDFSKEDLRTGAKKILSGDTSFSQDKEAKPLKVGSTYQLLGEAYTVIGVNVESSFRVPFSSLKDTSKIEAAFIIPKHAYSGANQEAFVTELQQIFQTKAIAVPPKAEDGNAGLKADYLIIFCVFLLGLLNISYLYAYILDMRKRQYAIFRVCGCGRLRSVLQCFGELWLLSTAAYLVGVLLFQTCSLLIFSRLDASYRSILSIEDYLVYYLGYLLALLAVFLPVVVRHARRQPYALLGKQ